MLFHLQSTLECLLIVNFASLHIYFFFLYFKNFYFIFYRIHLYLLQLIWMSPSKGKRKLKHASNCPHKYLKLVEIVGYYGRSSDDEFVMYLIKNAVALKRIVIDPRHQILERNPVRTEKIKKEEAAARMSAKKQLEAKKPPGVQLLIL